MISVSNIPDLVRALLGLGILVSNEKGICLESSLIASQHILYRRFTNPLARLPGPEISKWTDLVYIYYWFSGQVPFYVHNLHEQYGKPIIDE